jgi:hypothetical protein
MERDLIPTRTAEGRSRAQKRGQHMGIPQRLTEPKRPKRRGDGQKAQPFLNSLAAMMSVLVRFLD